jgi:hypothetical protein
MANRTFNRIKMGGFLREPIVRLEGVVAPEAEGVAAFVHRGGCQVTYIVIVMTGIAVHDYPFSAGLHVTAAEKSFGLLFMA